jgi:hypothetical protein
MLSTKIENSKCTDDAVRSSNKGLVVISVLFIALPIAVIGCKMRCEKMRQSTGIYSQCCIYAMFFLVLGIVLISLGSVIMGKSGQCNANSVDAVKASSRNVILIGVVVVVASSGYLGYSYFAKKHGYAVTTSTFDFPTIF